MCGHVAWLVSPSQGILLIPTILKHVRESKVAVDLYSAPIDQNRLQMHQILIVSKAVSMGRRGSGKSDEDEKLRKLCDIMPDNICGI